MSKEHRDPAFRDELNEVWKEIKAIPGLRDKFYAEFPKKPYMIRHWRTGKILAKAEDKAIFLETAAKVISDYKKELEENGIASRIEKAREQLHNLSENL